MAFSEATTSDLEHGLSVAEGWSVDGYTEASRAYWQGMRDALRVVLGITREAPMVSGPGSDAAALTILGGRPR